MFKFEWWSYQRGYWHVKPVELKVLFCDERSVVYAIRAQFERASQYHLEMCNVNYIKALCDLPIYDKPFKL